MGRIANFLKGLAFTLPEPLLGPLRKARALGVIRSFSETEEPDLRVLAYLVSPGDTVLDIGANIGCYTRYLSARVGPPGHVYSVEPIPITFDILRSAVRKLGLRNVELFGCAIYDADGKATMEVPRYESGGMNYYQARISTAIATRDAARFGVDVRTIDSLLADVVAERLSVVKVDVEGAELACLRGAKRTLERTKAAWLVEVSGNPDDPASDARRLIGLLSSHGHAAFWYDGRGLRKRRPGDRSVNYFFLTERHVELLRRHFPFS